MFVLHQFEGTRDDVELGDVGLPNDGLNGDWRAVKSKRAVQAFTRADGCLRCDAEECREARLRIEVDGERSVSAQREILSKVGGRRGFGRPALEIHDGDELQVLTVPAARDKLYRVAGFDRHRLADRIEIVERVRPAIVVWHEAFDCRCGLAQVAVVHAEKMRRFRRSELPKFLRGRGRKACEAMHRKLIDQTLTLIEDQSLQREAGWFGDHRHRRCAVDFDRISVATSCPDSREFAQGVFRKQTLNGQVFPDRNIGSALDGS